MKEKKCIYFDHNGTSPPTRRHYEEVMEKALAFEGNPSSSHFFGIRAREAIQEARENIADLLGTTSSRIFFTGCATESNNTVIKGVCHHSKNTDHETPPRILISKAEHSSVVKAAEKVAFQSLGQVEHIGVNAQGAVEENELLKHVDKHTALVSLIYVNNEIGVINPVKELASSLKSEPARTHFHIDAVQALGKLDCSWIGSSEIDSVALSGHKVGSFKGVGVLYLKSRGNIPPLLDGGGQEHGVRAGTENLQGIISFGLKAQEIRCQSEFMKPIEAIWTYLVEEMSQMKELHIHTPLDCCVRNTINFHLDDPRPHVLSTFLDREGFALSKGSACSSRSAHPSRVLLAMGYSEDVARNSIRVSLGPNNTMNEAHLFIRSLKSYLKYGK